MYVEQLGFIPLTPAAVGCAPRGRTCLLVEQLVRLRRAVLHARTTVVMNFNPMHERAEARPTGRRTKCALAERSRRLLA